MSELERIEKLIESNAKAIQAMTNQASSVLPRLDEMQRQVIDNVRRIDDNTADIRELTLENQRIFKYLESLNN